MTDQTQLTNLKDVKSTLELPYMTFANIIINLHYIYIVLSAKTKGLS